MKYILGIDTSNYTTSISLCDLDGNIVLNEKMMLPVKPGSRGLRQSDAVFEHTRNIPLIIDLIRGYDIVAVGYSKSPRDEQDSYMPCFLVGKSIAMSISSSLDVPCFGFSHQKGHIRAALYSCHKQDLLSKKFIAFHLSGGTSEILFVDNMNISLIGQTNDITAGQLIDRTGVYLGLNFPCGKEMDEIADYNTDFSMKPSITGLEFNLSGAENKVKQFICKGVSAPYVCGFVVKFIYDTLFDVCRTLNNNYQGMPLIFSGGVSSNSFLRKNLSASFDAYFCEPQYSCDNACGVALLTYDKINGH